ncbi:MAG TPA: tRNA (adenosine(37)-N6)-dimethylallyltransferase MiaA [Candidatus Izemoplasmatales bacterium]|nr:tRNA (adenosine(37)-N6)-dimethylallyltransferase MiaA [Bacillota bacterium]HRY77700.1 tRNA (adenosine(37)-N6)-dimethylallyltransferase MiaA [Candidatus Izemoplasmatales bacterium]
MMKPIVAIVGPTAVGKTTLSLALAHRYGGEIISADAMQFYRGFDIGTAKLPVSDREGVSHHLIDILDPEADFSAAEYQTMVRGAIDDLRNRGVLPILVGGSGLYIRSVLYDYRFEGEKRNRRSTEFYEQLSNGELFEILKTKDPDAAAINHPNNRKRIIRLLELAEATGTQRSETADRLYYPDALPVGLYAPREELVRRIDERVDAMLQRGLIEEVRTLYDRNIRGQALAAIGYKELYSFFDGKCTLESAVEAIKIASHRYAKRQMTWFRNQMNVQWFESDLANFSRTLSDVTAFLDPHLGK